MRQDNSTAVPEVHKPERRFTISKFENETDTLNPTVEEHSFEGLKEIFKASRRSECSTLDCKGRTCPGKAGNIALVLARLGERIASAVEYNSLAMFDLDKLRPESVAAVFQALGPYKTIVTSTHSHLKDGLFSLRVVIATDRNMSPGEYTRVAKEIARRLGLPADTTCFDPSHCYFAGSHMRDVDPFFWSNDTGALLCVDDFLTESPPATLQTPAHNLDAPVYDLEGIRAQLRKSPSVYANRLGRGEPVSPPPHRRGPEDKARRAAWASAILAAILRAPPSTPAAVFEEICKESHAAEVREDPDNHTPWEKTGDDKRGGVREIIAEKTAAAPRMREEWKAKEDAEFKAMLAAMGLVPSGEPLKAEAPVKVEDLRKYRHTDLGLAELLRDQHSGRVMFVSALKAYFFFDGRRWVRDSGGVNRLLVSTVRSLYIAASKVDDPDQRAALIKFATRCESADKLDAALRIAKSLEGIAADVNELDADPMVLNVANGTLDLRTGRLKPHDPKDRLTRITPVVFDPAATCPLFDKYIEKVLPDETLRQFVHKAVGYSLTGKVGEQVLIFLIGSGANGKSVLLVALKDLLGEYAVSGAPDLLLAKHGESHPAELAALRGARLVACSEIEEGRYFAEARLKQLTGGDILSVRGMRENFYDLAPTWTIWLLANHRPRVRTGGDALWRRMRMVPFEVVIPDGEKDPHLNAKLKEGELSGILNWALAGCLLWQKEGLGHPERITEAVKDYKVEQDVFARWLEENCKPATGGWESTADLHRDYRAWCEKGGEYWLEKTQWGERMGSAGFLPQKKGDRGWSGIALRNPPVKVQLTGKASGKPDTPDTGRGDLPLNENNGLS